MGRPQTAGKEAWAALPFQNAFITDTGSKLGFAQSSYSNDITAQGVSFCGPSAELFRIPFSGHEPSEYSKLTASKENNGGSKYPKVKYQ